MTATKQSGGFIIHRRNNTGPIQATAYRVAEGGTRVENADYNPAMFREGSYTTTPLLQASDLLPSNLFNFPVYRADSKGEFLIDAVIGLAKISGAFLTGGSSSAGIASVNFISDVTVLD